ncbi:MAG: hypothetical protein HYT22_00795 [Candidatus Niyogibacteria bacterium]|nr:hypothetical protein [Candidatus Niyogibacteria bacterium]
MLRFNNRCFIAITILAAMGIFSLLTAIVQAQPITQIAQPPAPQFDNFIEFLPWLFRLMLAAATLLSVFVIVIAGFQWMTGAISPPQVEAAKKRITAAVGGLILAFLSFLILNTINPELVSLRPPQPLGIDTTTWVCPTGEERSFATESECNSYCGSPDLPTPGLCAETSPPGNYQQTNAVPSTQTCESIGGGWVSAPGACSSIPPVGFRCCGLPK